VNVQPGGAGGVLMIMRRAARYEYPRSHGIELLRIPEGCKVVATGDAALRGEPVESVT
jgi:hypothetical protein